MADRVTVVSPRDPWPFSTVTADDLEALVADGLLRPLSSDPQPEWLAALHPPVEAGVGATVHPCHPRVFEQGVAAPVVLSPE
jgi:hypothetical protein